MKDYTKVLDNDVFFRKKHTGNSKKHTENKRDHRLELYKTGTEYSGNELYNRYRELV